MSMSSNNRVIKHSYTKLVLVISIWVKVFKNGPSKICGRQPLKNLKWKKNLLSPILTHDKPWQRGLIEGLIVIIRVNKIGGVE